MAGDQLGEKDREAVGLAVVGASVAPIEVGDWLGDRDGEVVGPAVGDSVGLPEGDLLGVAVVDVGVTTGVAEGLSEGDAEREREGLPMAGGGGGGYRKTFVCSFSTPMTSTPPYASPTLENTLADSEPFRASSKLFAPATSTESAAEASVTTGGKFTVKLTATPTWRSFLRPAAL